MGRISGRILDEPPVVPAPAGYLPPYVRAVIDEAARAELRPIARARRPHDPATPVLIAVMRDEAPRLPGFLAHYRGLGVTRFAVVDNGSADATRAILAAAPDVDLWSVTRPFWGKQGWVNALIARHGYDRWYLHVDADERLVYAGAPALGLAGLIGLAEARGLRRLRGMLVDLYPPGPLLAPEPGGPLFDLTGYAETLCLERISRKGGPRRRAFGRAGEDRAFGDGAGDGAIFDPELTKYPLFHIRAGEVVSSPHHLHPYRENYRSACFLALLHDKFGPGFVARAARAAAERNYWGGSLEYRRTLAVLARDPGLVLACPDSRRYRTPADLVAAGLIAPLDDRPGLRRSVAGWSRRRAVVQA